MSATTQVIPIRATFGFDDREGTFRMKVSTRVKAPGGAHYEQDVEVSTDLGALVTLLFSIWSGLSFDPLAATAMRQPTAVALPVSTATVTGWNYSPVTIPHEADVGDFVVE